MFAGISFTILTGLIWVGTGAIISLVMRRKLDYSRCMLFSGLLSSLLSAIFYIRWDVLLAGLPPYFYGLLLCFLFAGIGQACGFEVMLRAMRTGPHAIVWAIVQAALVIPFIANLVLWHAPVRLSGILGLLVVLGGIILLSRVKVKQTADAGTGGHWLVLTLAAFLCIGAQQTLCTYPSQWVGWEDTANLRPTLLVLMTAVGWFCIRCFTRPTRGRGIFVPALALSVCGLSSSLLLFLAMDSLRSDQMTAIVFPAAIGTCIAGFALYGRFALREPVSWPGVACVVAGVTLLSL